MSTYNKVIEKIKSSIEAELIDQKDYELFEKANIEHLNYIINLYDTYCYYSEFYNDENELSLLKSKKIPEDIVEFYSDYEPKNIPVFNCGVYLLDLNTIKEENSSREPSMYLIKYGIITIATTIGGNPICLDLNKDIPDVMIADYSFCSYNDDLNCIEIDNGPDELMEEFEEEDYIEFTYDNIIRCFNQVAPTFFNFIENLANEKYGDNIEKSFL